MRRTVAAAMVAALVMSGCGGASDPDQDPEPGPSPTVPQAADDEPTGDDPAAEPTDEDAATEGTAATDEDDETTGQETATSDDDPTGTPTDEDTEARGLADGPDWVDPKDEVRVSPDRDTSDVAQEITGIRIAGHDDFDRVVLDLTGDEVVLGWFGLYEDAPYEAGSGNPIDFAGNAVLSVPVDGIEWTNPHPDRTDGSDLGGPGGTGNVVEVVFGVLFEGQQQVFVSVVDRTPYRIFPLNDPARIVIDVQHS